MTGRAMLDTSVLIAREAGRPMDHARIPEKTALSVVSLAELHAGVLAARDIDTRARRLDTISKLAGVKVIGIDEHTGLTWAKMRAHLAQCGRRVNVNDLWIAASAAVHKLPVVTQDDDFAPLEGIAGLEVIRV